MEDDIIKAETTAADEPLTFVGQTPRATKRCPLSFGLSAQGVKCLGEICALWDEYEEQCLIRSALLDVISDE